MQFGLFNVVSFSRTRDAKGNVQLPKVNKRVCSHDITQICAHCSFVLLLMKTVLEGGVVTTPTWLSASSFCVFS